MKFPNLKFLSVDSVVNIAQRLVEKYDVGPRDAIHVACAIKNGERKIISDDRALDRIKEIERIPLHKALAG